MNFLMNQSKRITETQDFYYETIKFFEITILESFYILCLQRHVSLHSSSISLSLIVRRCLINVVVVRINMNIKK